jgi:hypothetical protein
MRRLALWVIAIELAVGGWEILFHHPDWVLPVH